MRPRLLVMPSASRAEWPILPLLEEWADVAVATGAWVRDGMAAEQAVASLEERGWDQAVLVVDEWAIFKAAEVASLKPELIRALAIGHAALELRTEGERPTLNGQVVAGYSQLMQTDFRTWARALTQTTRGDYDDAAIDQFMRDTSEADIKAFFERVIARMGHSFEPVLRELDVPMLFGHHTQCLLWTDESFRDVVAAFPEAATVRTTEKCSVSADFAAALREFCESL
jgi:hypothetical protein